MQVEQQPDRLLFNFFHEIEPEKVIFLIAECISRVLHGTRENDCPVCRILPAALRGCSLLQPGPWGLPCLRAGAFSIVPLPV